MVPRPGCVVCALPHAVRCCDSNQWLHFRRYSCCGVLVQKRRLLCAHVLHEIVEVSLRHEHHASFGNRRVHTDAEPAGICCLTGCLTARRATSAAGRLPCRLRLAPRWGPAQALFSGDWCARVAHSYHPASLQSLRPGRAGLTSQRTTTHRSEWCLPSSPRWHAACCTIALCSIRGCLLLLLATGETELLPPRATTARDFPSTTTAAESGGSRAAAQTSGHGYTYV